MNKTLVLCLALLIVVGLIIGETYAYFINYEPNNNNSFVSGSLALKTNDSDGVSQTLYDASISPGTTVGASLIALKNVGTTDGNNMDVVSSYAESDGSPNTVNKSADDLSALMEVIILTYGESDLLSGINDVNGNFYKDVYDLTNSNLTELSGIAASTTKDFIISTRLRSETGNDFQSDGIALTITFTLKQ